MEPNNTDNDLGSTPPPPPTVADDVDNNVTTLVDSQLETTSSIEVSLGEEEDMTRSIGRENTPADENNMPLDATADSTTTKDNACVPVVLEAASIALPPSKEEGEKEEDEEQEQEQEEEEQVPPTSIYQETVAEHAVPQGHSLDNKNEENNVIAPPPREEEEKDVHKTDTDKEDELQPPVIIKPTESKAEDSTTQEDSHLQQEEDGESEALLELPWWYPKCCGRPMFKGNKIALGWCCTAVAQAGILIGVGAFMLPAIAKLAKEQAGCETEAPSGEDLPECHGKVYGIKPSSLLTLLSSVFGLVSAILIPPIGAVVDFTSHRRLIGRWVSVLYSLGVLCMIFLDDDSWLAISLILTLSVSLGWAQTVLMNAYLPEMTEDENELNNFSKKFTVLIFCTMVFCLAVIMGIAMAFGFAEDDIALARCSAVVGFVLSAFLFFASWWLLFDERMAMHELPTGQTLVGAGFRQVGRTAVKIWTQYQGLKWFYISISFGDAAIQSLSIIAITYVTDQLEFDSQEVASAALLLLLGSIPGAIIGAWFNKLFNPIRSSALSVFGMMIGTGIGAIVLKGPGQQLLTYFFAFLWGFGTGWKYTGDRVLAAGIIPAGQDAELMGFYMFCGQIFAWVPSLVYTLLNEAGVSQRIGLSTLCVVFLGAFLSYCMMGSYSEAVGAADRLRVDSIPSVQQQQQRKLKEADAIASVAEETGSP